ncbi:MAG: hypothetical protein EHM58_13320 [Ignavibacteriae bacterium]|nr:MAG: hypothetical protein EHM58_13320 [Ignavibacteriota bacterium]
MKTAIKYFLATTMFYFCSVVSAVAQNEQKDVNIDVNVQGGQWYTNWWIWVIVALLFIITIVAISTRGRRA